MEYHLLRQTQEGVPGAGKARPSIFNFSTLCSLSQVEQYVNYLMKRYNYSNSSALSYNYCINTFFFICFNLYLLHCHDEDTLTL